MSRIPAKEIGHKVVANEIISGHALILLRLGEKTNGADFPEADIQPALREMRTVSLVK